jgi:hypothetical protein
VNIDLIAKAIVRDTLREMDVTGVQAVAEEIVIALREAGLLLPDSAAITHHQLNYRDASRGLADVEPRPFRRDPHLESLEEPWVDVDSSGKHRATGPSPQGTDPQLGRETWRRGADGSDAWLSRDVPPGPPVPDR